MSNFSRFLDQAQGIIQEAQAANPKLSAWRHGTGVWIGLPDEKNPEPVADHIVLRVEQAAQEGHVTIWATDKKGKIVDACVKADDDALTQVRKATELMREL